MELALLMMSASVSLNVTSSFDLYVFRESAGLPEERPGVLTANTQTDRLLGTGEFPGAPPALAC